MASFSKALGNGNLGLVDYYLWCFNIFLSPLATIDLISKAREINELISHDHEVEFSNCHFKQQNIHIMHIDNPMVRLNLSSPSWDGPSSMD